MMPNYRQMNPLNLITTSGYDAVGRKTLRRGGTGNLLPVRLGKIAE
jgi:hypothetical protein